MIMGVQIDAYVSVDVDGQVNAHTQHLETSFRPHREALEGPPRRAPSSLEGAIRFESQTAPKRVYPPRTTSMEKWEVAQGTPR